MATTTEDWSVPVQEQEVRDLDARYRSLPSGEQKKAAKAEYKAALNTLFEDQAERTAFANTLTAEWKAKVAAEETAKAELLAKETAAAEAKKSTKKVEKLLNQVSPTFPSAKPHLSKNIETGGVFVPLESSDIPFFTVFENPREGQPKKDMTLRVSTTMTEEDFTSFRKILPRNTVKENFDRETGDITSYSICIYDVTDVKALCEKVKKHLFPPQPVQVACSRPAQLQQSAGFPTMSEATCGPNYGCTLASQVWFKTVAPVVSAKTSDLMSLSVAALKALRDETNAKLKAATLLLASISDEVLRRKTEAAAL